MGQQTKTRDHPPEVREAYEQALSGADVRRRFVETADGRVHVLERGEGPPLVLLPGDGSFAAWYLPLMHQLEGVRMVAPDRPGQGLSDPIDFTAEQCRDASVAWVGRLLDALDLESAALAGHSGGGMWALWFALDRPERVRQLVLFAPPALPHTHLPVPLRVMGTPGVGDLMGKLTPPSRKSLTQFAGILGEAETVAQHPPLLDLWVASGRDPVADSSSKQSFRALISPLALVSPAGFRRRARMTPEELGRLRVPTLLVWGEKDPLADAATAREIAGLMPDCTLALLPTGHMPWLGEPERAASAVRALVA